VTEPRYWDNVLKEMREVRPLEAWRAYMQCVYQRLIREWIGATKGKIKLKTDLFEEAISSHYPISDLGEGSIGVDVSWSVVSSAQKSVSANGRYKFLVADLRHIPLQSESVNNILSGSSLDHFSNESDLDRGLQELARILAPDGILILTMDNPQNPMIWIRNHLPFGFLNKMGIVPYYVGKTLGHEDLNSRLKSMGLSVSDVTAVAHAPRAPAIWAVKLSEFVGWKTDWIQRALNAFETLENLPTRFFTGYYVALRAVKNGKAKT
jgi:SAM-dependent methyltransferase